VNIAHSVIRKKPAEASLLTSKNKEGLLGEALLHRNVTNLVERLECARRDLYGYPATFLRNPDALLLQVRQKPATRLVVRMRYVIAVHHTFTGEFTASGHEGAPRDRKG
jgi:hypothetical protein